MSENKDTKEELNSDKEHIENTVQEETNEQTSENSQETNEVSADEKYAELNDKFLRLYSEFDNYRKRTNKEKIDLIGSASAGLMKDLIPVLDDFERAITNNENVKEVDALKEGFQLIFTKFKATLESKGLKQMNAKGEAFDSELHEAIANIPTEDENLKGKVIDDVEKGYFLNEKVVRYAKVVVGQ
jgi:molecular chaperone GrpE